MLPCSMSECAVASYESSIAAARVWLLGSKLSFVSVECGSSWSCTRSRCELDLLADSENGFLAAIVGHRSNLCVWSVLNAVSHEPRVA